ncbi:MAG: nucleotide exchange factor GrpE [Bacteroidales bacterium]|nr:nucleotide exchange factor GrpE [Bacteroidales bacterium]
MTKIDNTVKDKEVVNKNEKEEVTKASQKKSTTKTHKKSTAKKHTPKKDDSSNKLKELEDTNKELHDKYLRLSAEFDNYRKRTLKEKADLTKYAGAEILKNILPVIDDFERGMKNIEQAGDIQAIKDGVIHIYNKFGEFLKQNGVKEIDALKKDFDYDFHEAITKIPAPEKNLKGKIVDVIEKGYLLNDKVIRFSKVVIGE